MGEHKNSPCSIDKRSYINKNGKSKEPASTKPAVPWQCHCQWAVPWRGDMARRGGGRVVGDGGGRAVAVPMVGLQAAAPIGSA